MGVTLKKEVRKVIPEGVSESEIERLIPQSRETDLFGDLKGYQRSIGHRPCALEVCSNVLPEDARPNRKYCSTNCSDKARSRRYRKRSPEAKMRADLKYLKYLEEEGDL